MQIFSKRFIFILVLISGSRDLKLLAQMPVADVDHPNKKVICRNGAVVSANRLASMAGIQMLKQGGNAVDAAIATQLALAVVYPGAGNIGGGGFMVARLANGNNITIDFREKAPAAASRNMYLDVHENVVPGKSENGHPAVGVPGSVAGIFSYYKYAKLPFR
jgi:gamma-glutamyltranspeptidase/glutathione hydrolase